MRPSNYNQKLSQNQFTSLLRGREFWWGANDSSSGTKTLASVLGGEGLPTAADAQRLQVQRYPKLLTEEEMTRITEVSLEIRREGAGSVLLRSDPWEKNSHYGDDRGEWYTTYVHYQHMFQNRLPQIYNKLWEAALKADRDNWQIIDTALAMEGNEDKSVQPRCIEWHNVGYGGLPNHRHFDSGSCVTLDLMLHEAAGGGKFETLEINEDGSETPVQHVFERGDAIVFPSHKYHSVSPVTDVSAGNRQVLIMEAWIGERRKCRHRCEQHWGYCPEEQNASKWNSATGSYVAW